VPGKLTDHYDPTKRALFLSEDNFRERSIAAVGVAAHEAGHALQHQAAYAPLKLRMAMVPVTKFASTAYSLILLASFVLMGAHKISGGMFSHMITFVIVLFSIITFFQLVTLPVEFDASRRAKEQLMGLNIVRPQEGEAVGRVLNAAALTYVAAMITSVMELLYWISISRNRN
jgi:Zn-dependent membrane protease YugP